MDQVSQFIGKATWALALAKLATESPLSCMFSSYYIYIYIQFESILYN